MRCGCGNELMTGDVEGICTRCRNAIKGVKYQTMVVNEEGFLLHELDHNPVASEIAGLFIVGPAVLCSRGEVK